MHRTCLEVRPAEGLGGCTAYHVPRPEHATDLRLDGNEGAAPDAALLEYATTLRPELLRDYPSTAAFGAQLARELDVTPEHIVVTGGADDALDRACRAVLGPGRELILPVPTFEMLERYPRLVGARIAPVPWRDGAAYPLDAVLARVNPQTGAIAVVTPNNPTGAVATAEELRRLSAAAPHCLLIVDLAYGEFADHDLLSDVRTLPNALAVRTFSKAWGLAGLRVGYAVGPSAIIEWLRAAGSPYPTAGLSLALASKCLATGRRAMEATVARVRQERAALERFLRDRGAAVTPSQGNFVFGRYGDAGRVWTLLAATGIAVRAFPGRPGLEDALRITCPASAAAFARLLEALSAAYRAAPAAFASTRPQEDQP